MVRLLAAAAALLVVSCVTSPTGRKQFIAVPDSQMDAMGAQAFDQMKKEIPTSRNAALNDYVKCVAQPIAQQAAPETGVQNWEIVVFEEKTANAFALPGGKIGVHTGILPVAQTDAQLAAVLGHEVGHVIAKHSAERMSQALAAQGGLLAAGALTKDSKNRGLILGALGLGAQFGILMPYGRTQESEADQVGQKLMAQAGFDPRESVTLWENMKAAAGGAPPEFMSTHPSSDTRIRDLQAHMGEVTPIFERATSRPQCKRP